MNPHREARHRIDGGPSCCKRVRYSKFEMRLNNYRYLYHFTHQRFEYSPVMF